MHWKRLLDSDPFVGVGVEGGVSGFTFSGDEAVAETAASLARGGEAWPCCFSALMLQAKVLGDTEGDETSDGQWKRACRSISSSADRKRQRKSVLVSWCTFALRFVY